MKKRIICGSAAILLTGLTGAMFTMAAPHARETAPAAAAPVVDAPIYAPSLGPAGNAARPNPRTNEILATVVVTFPA